MNSNFYRIEDVAKKLGISVRSVFRYIHEGKLKATKIGFWRIIQKDLDDFIARSSNVSGGKKNKK